MKAYLSLRNKAKVVSVHSIKEKIFNLNKNKTRDDCVRFKEVQQQESELQSYPSQILQSYKLIIPASLP